MSKNDEDASGARNDDSPGENSPMTRPCAQCGRPAVNAYETGTKNLLLPLCLEHSEIHERMAQRRIEVLDQRARQLDNDAADIFGLPRRYQPPATYVSMGGINRINITGSTNVAVNIRARADQAMTLTSGVDDPGLKHTLSDLVAAIRSHSTLNETSKDDALQLAGGIAEEAAKTQPRKAVLTASFDALTSSLKLAKELGPYLRALGTALATLST